MQLHQINKRATNIVKNIFDSRAVKYTQIVVILVISGLVVWDIFLYTKAEETISSVIRNSSQNKLFVITWIWGVMSSHLFVCRRADSKTVPEIIAIIVLLLISVIIFLLGKFINIEIPQYMHIILLVFGGISGYFLWPQKV